MTTPNSTLRKAAILIASLDETTARRLLNQMGPTQAARVRDAVAALDQINPIEQEQVISEFFRHNPPSAAPIERGVELAGSLSRHSQADDHEDDHDHDTNNRGDDDHVGHGMDDATYTAIPSIGSAVAGEPANKPFRFLHGAKAEIVTPYLEREHPQTIAVVLSHLPAEKAADVLGKFS